jgi:hypothetical protein
MKGIDVSKDSTLQAAVARVASFWDAFLERRAAAEQRAAIALAIMQLADQAEPRRRLLFCNHLISLADLESYDRRGAFIAAFSASGTHAARLAEAKAIAKSGLLTLDDIAFFNKLTLAFYNPWAKHRRPMVIR